MAEQSRIARVEGKVDKLSDDMAAVKAVVTNGLKDAVKELRSVIPTLATKDECTNAAKDVVRAEFDSRKKNGREWLTVVCGACAVIATVAGLVL